MNNIEFAFSYGKKRQLFNVCFLISPQLAQEVQTEGRTDESILKNMFKLQIIPLASFKIQT